MVFLSKEIIEQIVSAEDKAQELIREAQQKAAESLKACEEELVRAERALTGELKEQRDEIINERRERTAGEIAGADEKRMHERDSIKAEALSRVDAASGMIFERIVS